ncbi:MAG: inner membrane protein import complex subunit Tim54-domain-containing protein [Olpidium bornovanus]|uniref:Mitochondrial import inner membrane translocase subunit TIM54 n=1 Tax=Olpidium bornovanus TaxID=278681 RepID=A0A8H8DHQ0_9FUNG|nr:MAG: inner membrane protein import complex subunit Tim54-domain-containing protein [Olpidium bornovanus]
MPSRSVCSDLMPPHFPRTATPVGISGTKRTACEEASLSADQLTKPCVCSGDAAPAPPFSLFPPFPPTHPRTPTRRRGANRVAHTDTHTHTPRNVVSAVDGSGVGQGVRVLRSLLLLRHQEARRLLLGGDGHLGPPLQGLPPQPPREGGAARAGPPARRRASPERPDPQEGRRLYHRAAGRRNPQEQALLQNLRQGIIHTFLSQIFPPTHTPPGRGTESPRPRAKTSLSRYFLPPPTHALLRDAFASASPPPLPAQPIWDAAALDYELREGAKPGDIQRHVRNNFRRERRRPHVPAAGALEGLPRRKEGLPDGIVAVGRLAFVETMNGISAGSFGPVYDHDRATEAEAPKPEADKAAETGLLGGDGENKEKAAGETTNAEPRKKSKAEIEEEEAWNEAQRIPLETLHIVESSPTPPRVPPVGFIPQRNIIGWARLPERVLSWFTDYKQVRSIGERALAIAEDRRRRTADVMAWELLGEDEESEVTRWGLERRKLEFDRRLADTTEIFLTVHL